MKYVEYPKWKYCDGREPVLVQSSEEEAALVGEWVDSPADVKKFKPEIKGKKAKDGGKA